ncbi:hypothetical protein [Nocardia alba]|nr:hypothetical protein [Nocardia alba]
MTRRFKSRHDLIVKNSEDFNSEVNMGEAIYAFRAIADTAAKR